MAARKDILQSTFTLWCFSITCSKGGTSPLLITWSLCITFNLSRVHMQKSTLYLSDDRLIAWCSLVRSFPLRSGMVPLMSMTAGNPNILHAAVRKFHGACRANYRWKPQKFGCFVSVLLCVSKKDLWPSLAFISDRPVLSPAAGLVFISDRPVLSPAACYASMVPLVLTSELKKNKSRIKSLTLTIWIDDGSTLKNLAMLKMDY